MPSCVAFGCTNRPGKKTDITFHRFPKKESLRAEWVKACRRKDWVPSKSSVLCSNHFSEDQFDRTSLSCTRLRENAIPNHFSAFPPYLQNKPSACCNPVTSSLPSKQGSSDETLAPGIKNVRSTNEIAVDQNKPGYVYRKNDYDKNTVVIVSDTEDYKKVLNGPSDANRRIVVSDKLNETNSNSSAFAHIENVGSTNDKVVVENETVAAPTIINHGKNDPDKVMVLIVRGTPKYKDVLNSNPYENRKIVVSDQLIPNNRLSNSLSNTYQTSSGSAVSEAASEPIGKNKHKNNPLLLVDDGVLSQRIKELEEVVKILLKKKKIWNQKIRRTKRKLKELRNKYIRLNKKNPTILRRSSQPLVHFLARDVQNV
ncbi:hypothetical protein JTE90_011426 [Oedothorax gibbosus]|uniref:THAP-type domain-containing protein n=1 Tax=Oedothorax gibbosus TaxID=931172 RepID=A0AAV6VBX4_9ARAC|nr:hypothetical protein JTE90_011426 [Oedothorax gibbosus]